MIYIKRSVDIDKEVTWVANDMDEERFINKMLYAGNDVNGAIEAATKAGLPWQKAIDQAKAEVERCLRNGPTDNIYALNLQGG